MKYHLQNLLALCTLAAALGLGAERSIAQTFTTLINFDTHNGENPFGGLTISGNTIYGTASTSVFRMNKDGSGYTNLIVNSGDEFWSELVLSGNTLYGTAASGGTNGVGAVFAINTDGSDFTNLHSFASGTNNDGNWVRAGLVLYSNRLFGTATYGGTGGNGTIFAVNTDGTGFTNLHSFAGPGAGTLFLYPSANSDGAFPISALARSGNTLYGTTYTGGSSGNGAIFAINTDGSGFTNIHNFSADELSDYTNSDGARPSANLIAAGNTLYGTAAGGGSGGSGTIFAFNTDGSGFRTIFDFPPVIGNDETNSSGAGPAFGDLTLSGNTLYGTTAAGGTYGLGTLFAINTDESGFTNLYNFTNCTRGQGPSGGLTVSANTLYGVSDTGGSSVYYGYAFSLSFSPQLTLGQSGANLTLTWPTNATGIDYTGYTLESSTNFTSPTGWSPVTATPAIVNGQMTVTPSLTGPQMFFRLRE